MRIHLVPNSHIDPVWLWDKYEGIDEVIATFRSAADRLDEFPALTFTASSLQFYEWVRQYDPPLFARIRQLVAAGRWEVVGGWWVEADSNLPTEASFRKHAELSQAFAKEHFGLTIEVAYLPDSFGHPATLPAILAETGFKYFIFCRPSAWEKTDLPANRFWWEHSGHRILAYRLKHHYAQWADPAGLTAMMEDQEYRQYRVNSHFFGVGDHGGGPTIAEIQFYEQYIRQRPAGDVGFSSCLRFFREAEQHGDIPVYAGDLHMHAVGCYSVIRPLKAAMRKAEHGLAFAGRALAMAGRPVAELDGLWQRTLFNQFHDILPGSCAPHAAAQAIAELGGVENAWRDVAYSALKGLAASRPVTVKEGEFRIFNTLPFTVTVPLAVESCAYYREGAAFRDETGQELTIQEVLPSVRCGNRRWEFVDTLPANGFKSYYFDNTTTVARPPASTAHFGSGDAIASDLAQVRDNQVFLGTDQQPFLAGPLRFLVLADRSDTWGHAVRSYDDVEGAFTLESSAMMSGGVTAKLFQKWNYGRSSLEVVYSVYAGLPQVRLDVTVRWVEDRKILKLELRPRAAAATNFFMQGAGGQITRRADGAELPLHHWVRVPAWPHDAVILQDGAFAADCETGRLRLTLVRSSYYGYHDPTQLVAADPQRRTDQGEHHFRLCLLHAQHLDEVALHRLAAAFLEPYSVIREGLKQK